VNHRHTHLRVVIARLRARRGASALTYGLMIGLVAVVALLSVQRTGTRVNSLFGRLADGLAGVPLTGGDPTPIPTGTGTPTPTPVPTPAEPGVASCAPAAYDAGLDACVLGDSGTQTAVDWTVPTGVTGIAVQMWGAGGGGGPTASGGPGGFSSGDVAVTVGETLTFVVGEGGHYNDASGSFGGGGAGGDGGDLDGSSGGGLTGLFRGSSGSRANALIIAGGGGGAGSNLGSGADDTDGGAGGGLVAEAVQVFNVPGNNTYLRTGGRQVEGGESLVNGQPHVDCGPQGGALAGADGTGGGAGIAGGSGGGGGYFGGASGCRRGVAVTGYGDAGSGGSGFIGGAGVTNAQALPDSSGCAGNAPPCLDLWSGTAPPNTGSAAYGGEAGVGGAVGTDASADGGDGRVIFTW